MRLAAHPNLTIALIHQRQFGVDAACPGGPWPQPINWQGRCDIDRPAPVPACASVRADQPVDRVDPTPDLDRIQGCEPAGSAQVQDASIPDPGLGGTAAGAAEPSAGNLLDVFA